MIKNQEGHQRYESFLPISVVLRNYVKDVSFPEIQSSFFARNIRIDGRIVVEMRSNSNFAFPRTALTVGRYQFEGYRSFGVLLKNLRKLETSSDVEDCDNLSK